MSALIKRSDKVIYYKPAKEDEEAGGDLQQLLSFILIFGGMMMKVKWMIWASFFLNLSSFFTMKSKGDYKQIMITMGMSMVGLLSLYYFQPPPVNQQTGIQG